MAAPQAPDQVSECPVTEWQGMTPERFHSEIVPSYRPAVFRHYVRDWPVVMKQAESTGMLSDYIRQFDIGGSVVTYCGDPAIQGRFFYQEDLAGFNFERITESFTEGLQRLLAEQLQPNPRMVYMGSVSIQETIPGFIRENHCNLAGSTAVSRIWLGNAATVPTHYDVLDNIVCAIAGRRRFTLFPPEQLPNLYVGPLDFTLAGQPVSMVSLKQPDFDRYPRFREALAAAQVVELEPGDALFIPKLWWHNVESLESLNAIVNYWWDETAISRDSPFTALLHGLLTISHLPEPERKAWQAFFNHYVFRNERHPAEHIPESRRGVLGDMTPGLYQTLKQQILQFLSR